MSPPQKEIPPPKLVAGGGGLAWFDLARGLKSSFWEPSADCDVLWGICAKTYVWKKNDGPTLACELVGCRRLPPNKSGTHKGQLGAPVLVFQK
jgi:hypothetical protein